MAHDEYLTVAEIAELLKLNQQTVRNTIDRGDLNAVRFGRRVRVPRADLDHYLVRVAQAGKKSSARSRFDDAVKRAQASLQPGAGDDAPAALRDVAAAATALASELQQTVPDE